MGRRRRTMAGGHRGAFTTLPHTPRTMGPRIMGPHTHTMGPRTMAPPPMGIPMGGPHLVPTTTADPRPQRGNGAGAGAGSGAARHLTGTGAENGRDGG